MNVSPAFGSVIVKLYVFVCPSSAVVGGLSNATVGAVFAATTVNVGCATVFAKTVASLLLAVPVATLAAAVGDSKVPVEHEAVAVSCTVMNSPRRSRSSALPPVSNSSVSPTILTLQPLLLSFGSTGLSGSSAAEIDEKQIGRAIATDSRSVVPMPARVTRMRCVPVVPVVTDGSATAAPAAFRNEVVYSRRAGGTLLMTNAGELSSRWPGTPVHVLFAHVSTSQSSVDEALGVVAVKTIRAKPLTPRKSDAVEACQVIVRVTVLMTGAFQVLLPDTNVWVTGDAVIAYVSGRLMKMHPTAFPPPLVSSTRREKLRVVDCGTYVGAMSRLVDGAAATYGPTNGPPPPTGAAPAG